MVGALAAASAAGKFDPLWKLPARSLAGSMAGGLLLGLGSRMAYGCNIGAYFSGILSGSLHGWLWLLAAFAGSMAGVRLRPLFGLTVEKNAGSLALLICASRRTPCAGSLPDIPLLPSF